MITITAKAILIEGKKEAFIKTAQELIQESNKESWCISYNLYAVGTDYPILIKLNSADYIKEGGLTQEDSLYVAKKLADLGINAIEVTGGNESIKEVLDNNMGGF